MSKKTVYTPPVKDEKPAEEEPSWVDTVGAPWMKLPKEGK